MKDDVRQAVLQLFLKNSKCSFLELVQALEETGWQARGDSSLHLEKNLVLWQNLNAELCEVMRELITGSEIELKVLAPNLASIVYACTRSRPHLPMAEEGKTYETPHWLPVMMQLGKRR